jgi:hypothetical protein
MPKLLEKAITQIKKLPESQQNAIAQIVLNILNNSKYSIKGVQGKELIKFAGTISSDDLQLMSQAILEDCERIDINEW